MGVSEVRATVGRFISIRCANSTIVAMITEVSCERSADSDAYIASASVDLLGEILGAPDRPKFQRGVTNYPTIGDTVDLITNQELRTVYAPSGRTRSTSARCSRIGRSWPTSMSRRCCPSISRCSARPASASPAASSLLLHEILKARPNLRIFLLDVHNEYGRCFGDRAQVLNPRNLKLPFWLFNFEEIVDVLLRAAARACQEELDILAEVIPLAKGIYTQYQQRRPHRALKRIDPKTIGYTVDTPVPYRLVDLIALIDERMGKLENRSSRIIYHKLISRIETVRNDPRYAFMFDNANVGGDTMAEVISHLFRLPAERQADDDHAARRLPGRGRRLGGVRALPHGVRLRAVERRRCRRCCSSARRPTATPPPTATSASGRPARPSRASPRKAANTASISGS